MQKPISKSLHAISHHNTPSISFAPSIIYPTSIHATFHCAKLPLKSSINSSQSPLKPSLIPSSHNSSPSYQAQNAVLLLFFNRKDTTLRVLEQIARVKPPRIYLACDGGRNPLESTHITQLRQKVLRLITWTTHIYTYFSPSNQGCKMAVSNAISWFFSYEEQGIILEDDCLPSMSFFSFCDSLLHRYKHNHRIFLISGFSALDFAPNPSAQHLHIKAQLHTDYFFSRYPHIWGWASWARAWKHYNRDFKDFSMLQGFISRQEKRYWRKIFHLYTQKGIDTWDYPLAFSMWQHDMLAIYPKHNMISNIGFNRADATHTTGSSKFDSMPRYELASPLIHPHHIKSSLALDRLCFHISFMPPSLLARIIRRLKRIAWLKRF